MGRGKRRNVSNKRALAGKASFKDGKICTGLRLKKLSGGSRVYKLRRALHNARTYARMYAYSYVAVSQIKGELAANIEVSKEPAKIVPPSCVSVFLFLFFFPRYIFSEKTTRRGATIQRLCVERSRLTSLSSSAGPFRPLSPSKRDWPVDRAAARCNNNNE